MDEIRDHAALDIDEIRTRLEVLALQAREISGKLMSEGTEVAPDNIDADAGISR